MPQLTEEDSSSNDASSQNGENSNLQDSSPTVDSQQLDEEIKEMFEKMRAAVSLHGLPYPDMASYPVL